MNLGGGHVVGRSGKSSRGQMGLVMIIVHILHKRNSHNSFKKAFTIIYECVNGSHLKVNILKFI